MIYFDNAATSFPKPDSVIKEVNDCIKNYCGNPGRGAHYFSLKSSEKIYDTRLKIADFLNYNLPERVVFTENATYALNLAIKTTLKKNEHVLISDMEHNSVLRPIEALAKKGIIEYSIFSSKDIENSVDSLIQSNTSCIVSTLASNVTGEEISLNTLSKLRQKYKLKLIIDASQYIGHKPIDLSEGGPDVLCAPAHKALFGVQGLGFALFLDSDFRESFIEGGSGSESKSRDMPPLLPERFEAGTLPTPAIVGLSAGLDFINEYGLNNITDKLNALTVRAYDLLTSFTKIEIAGMGCGIISFRVNDIPCHVIADSLNKEGVATRSGLHCAPLIHKRLGTLESGTVRLSFSCLNSYRELDSFYKKLSSILKTV